MLGLGALVDDVHDLALDAVFVALHGCDDDELVVLAHEGAEHIFELLHLVNQILLLFHRRQTPPTVVLGLVDKRLTRADDANVKTIVRELAHGHSLERMGQILPTRESIIYNIYNI